MRSADNGQDMPDQRLLRAEDLHDAFTLSAAAGWNQTEADWKRLLLAAPDGCFAMEVDGKVVSTATIVTYGEQLAWIGMVLTSTEHRRRGYARLLVEKCLAVAAAKNISCVGLDASEEGRPLYKELGFVDEQEVERWLRDGDDSKCATVGDDLVLSGGACALHRTGRVARYVGPCFASNAVDAKRAIECCIESAPEAPWFWDLLPRNDQAVSIARANGFRRVRSLTRMMRGTPPVLNAQEVYAISGFEWG